MNVAPASHSSITRIGGTLFGSRPDSGSRTDEGTGLLRVDDSFYRDAACGGAVTAVRLPLELPGRVGIRVDGERATGLYSESEQPLGRIQPLGTRIDLDGNAELAASLEDDVGIELRLRPGAPPAGDQPAGAVTEHVCVRVGDRDDHPAGHFVLRRPKLGVDARHHDVESAEQ